MFFVHPQIQLNKKNIKLIFLSFFKKSDLNSLKKKLSSYFPEKNLVFTDMARSAFKIIVEKLKLQDSQVLFPAYICDIFYPILKRYNIKPVFIDINFNTFNINPEQVLEKITPETKAILISHTYGLPVDIKKLRSDIYKHRASNSEHQTSNLGLPIIIEDFSHAFGAKLNSDFIGNLGDISFFSLYKQFPSLRGGLLVCPKEWEINLPKTKFGFRDFISFLNCFPVFAFLFKKFGQGIAPRMVRKEKMSVPAGINSISLNFFFNFFQEYEKSFEHRIKLAMLFQEKLKQLGFSVQESQNNVFCYLSALIPKKLERKRDKFVELLRRENVFCTRIWHTPIVLNTRVQKEYNIDLENYPNTVEAAKRIINFPLQNYYTESSIRKMIESIKKVWLKVRG